MRKREREKYWNKDKVEIIKEFNELIQSRIEIEDIFVNTPETHPPLYEKASRFIRPLNNHPLQPNLRPLISYNPALFRGVTQQIRPLIRGKFYLTHGLDWNFWNTMPNYKYAGALDLIYILTKKEVKNYRRAKPLVTPREEPEEEIIAMKWPAYWASYSYFTEPTLQICSHIHHATGWYPTAAIDESEFVSKFMQLIPIGDAKIIALNYPNL